MATPTGPEITPVLARRGSRTLLLRARELRGPVSLRAAATRIGIRPDELARIERGETRQVRWETLLGIADAYDVDVSALLVTHVEPATELAYAGVLAAIRSGQVAAGVPRRFAGDPDRIAAERAVEHAAAAEGNRTEEAAFAESTRNRDRATRGPFRPAR